MDERFYEQLRSEKWKDRKDALDKLMGCVQDPGFEAFFQTDIGVLAEALAKCLEDANVLVTAAAACTIQKLARTYGSNLAPHARALLVPSFLRLKEKKQNVVEALRGALDGLAEILSKNDLFEEILSAVAQKNPQCKAETLRFLTRLVQTKRFPLRREDIKTIMEGCVLRAFEDSAPEVRDAGAEVAGTLIHTIGSQQPVQVYLEHMDKSKLLKVNEYVEKAQEAMMTTGIDKTNTLMSQPPDKRKEPIKTEERERIVPTDEHMPRIHSDHRSISTGLSESMSIHSPHENQPIAMMDLIEPVPILSKLSITFYQDLESSKWKDRKDALDGLLNLLKAPKFTSSDDYGELVMSLKKCIEDCHFLVVIAGANALERLACGLDVQFSIWSRQALPSLLDRLKEKKPNVVEALRTALDALCKSISLGELLEDATPTITQKNPQAKIELLRLLARYLQNARTIPKKEEVRILLEGFVLKSIDDGIADVRDASAELAGTLLKMLPSPQIAQPFLEKMESSKVEKVMHYKEKAIVQCTPDPSTMKAESTKRLPVVHSIVKQGKDVCMEVNGNMRPSSPLLIKGTKSAASSTKPATTTPVLVKSGLVSNVRQGGFSAGLTKTKLGKNPAMPVLQGKSDKKVHSSTPQRVGSLKFSDQEVEDEAPRLIPEALCKKLGDVAWKVRLEACDELLTHLRLISEPWSAENVELIAQFLMKRRPTVKESNFQIQGRMFQIITACIDERFGQQSIDQGHEWAIGALCIPWMTEKLSDTKIKQYAWDLAVRLGEQLSPGFVLWQVCGALSNQKSPKVLTDGIQSIQQFLLEFGVSSCLSMSNLPFTAAELIGFLKGTCLENANAGVRNSTVKLLGILRIGLGPEILRVLEGLKPALLSVIETEFDRVLKDPQSNVLPPSIRTSKLNIPHSLDKSEESGVEMLVPDSTKDLFPRNDISSQLNAKLFKELNDSSWKVRGAALDELQRILNGAQRRIQLPPAPILNEVFNSLKARMTDTNRNLCVSALNALTAFLEALLPSTVSPPGTTFTSTVEKTIKSALPSFLVVLGDSKVPVRTACQQALSAIRMVVSSYFLVPFLANALVNDNPSSTLRKDLLCWIDASFFHPLPDQPNTERYCTDWTSLVRPLLICLEDRAADVRKLTQQLLMVIGPLVGYEILQKQVGSLSSSLSASAIASIVAFLNKHRDKLQPTNRTKQDKCLDSSQTDMDKSRSNAYTDLPSAPKTTLSSSALLSPTHKSISTLNLYESGSQQSSNGIRKPMDSIGIVPPTSTSVGGGSITTSLLAYSPETVARHQSFPRSIHTNGEQKAPSVGMATDQLFKLEPDIDRLIASPTVDIATNGSWHPFDSPSHSTMDQKLKELLKRIGRPEEMMDALRQLYDFQQKNPYIVRRLDALLVETNMVFLKAKIQTGLALLSAEQKPTTNSDSLNPVPFVDRKDSDTMMVGGLSKVDEHMPSSIPNSSTERESVHSLRMNANILNNHDQRLESVANNDQSLFVDKSAGAPLSKRIDELTKSYRVHLQRLHQLYGLRTGSESSSEQTIQPSESLSAESYPVTVSKMDSTIATVFNSNYMPFVNTTPLSHSSIPIPTTSDSRGNTSTTTIASVQLPEPSKLPRPTSILNSGTIQSSDAFSRMTKKPIESIATGLSTLSITDSMPSPTVSYPHATTDATLHGLKERLARIKANMQSFSRSPLPSNVDPSSGMTNTGGTVQRSAKLIDLPNASDVSRLHDC